MIYQQSAQDPLVCPHCKKEQSEGVAIDYTLAHTKGHDSQCTEECEHCYKEFTVENNGDDTVSVSTETD